MNTNVVKLAVEMLVNILKIIYQRLRDVTGDFSNHGIGVGAMRLNNSFSIGYTGHALNANSKATALQYPQCLCHTAKVRT